MRLFQTTCLAIVTCAISTPAFSWWATGHALTAEVAKQHLTTVSQQRVDTLLNMPINFPELGDSNKQPKVDPKQLSHHLNTLATSATWADDIKRYYWKSYADKNAYTNMHFVDIPLILDAKQSSCAQIVTAKDVSQFTGDADTINIVNGIRSSLKTLLNAHADDQDHAVALRFLIHFVGDLHQPLHASDPMLHQHTSRGGNSLLFDNTQQPSYLAVNGSDPLSNIESDHSQQMHAFFDSSLSLFNQLPETMDTSYAPTGYELWEQNKTTYTHYLDQLINTLPTMHDQPSSTQLILQWTLDNSRTACQWLVNDKDISFTEDNDKNSTMHAHFTTNASDYEHDHALAAKQRLMLGGVRLAELLNAIYDPTHADANVVIYLNNQIVHNDKIPQLKQLASHHLG